MLDNYVFISVQPYDAYFTWQVEVQIVNFRKFGLSDKMHVLIWNPKGEARNGIVGDWESLEKKYSEVSFFRYEDGGDTNLTLYIPQLRPDALEQHFRKYPTLKEKVIFYHDCDILFNFLPDFEKLGRDDINWVSNTSSYLDYDYLARKEKQGNIPEGKAIGILCSIGNITPELMKSYAGKTGGAQYVLKGIDTFFWKDVKRQVLQIRKLFKHGEPDSINTTFFKSESEGFQSWCADMWAVNMALWSRGKITDVTPELDFSWATDNAETYLRKPIFHNAGANGTQPGVFFKGQWQKKSPIGKNLSSHPDSASKYYVQAIMDVK